MKKGLFILIMAICFVFGFGITAIFACDEVENQETYEVYGNIDYSIAKYLPDCNGRAIQTFDGTFSGYKANSEGYLPVDGNVYAKDSYETLDDGTVIKSNYTATDFASNSSFEEVSLDLNFETEIGSISEIILSENNFAKGTHSGKVKFNYNADITEQTDICLSAGGEGYTVALRSEDGKYLSSETSSITDFSSTTSCIIPEIVNSGTTEVQIKEISCDDYANTRGLVSYETGAGVRATAYSDVFNSGLIKTNHQTSFSGFVRGRLSRETQ